MQQSISETTAIRLFNSVVQTDEPNNGTLLTPIIQNSQSLPNTQTTQNGEIVEGCASIESIHSANEFGNSCRICRYNYSDMQILKCPCHCKGSVGFIHLACLKRWISHRRDNKCEICNAPFDIPEEKLNVRRMLQTFLCARCCGAIAKHMLFSASLVPLAHVVLQQVLLCMENINASPHEQLTIREVFVASCALLTSSAIFFHFFEFVTTRFLIIRNILRQWWMFGNTTDFEFVELENDIFEIF